MAEAAVVARPHSVKGECLYCFVTLAEGHEFDAALVQQLKNKGEAHIHTHMNTHTHLSNQIHEPIYL